MTANPPGRAANEAVRLTALAQLRPKWELGQAVTCR
jgi:hypothetical protein